MASIYRGRKSKSYTDGDYLPTTQAEMDQILAPLKVTNGHTIVIPPGYDPNVVILYESKVAILQWDLKNKYPVSSCLVHGFTPEEFHIGYSGLPLAAFCLDEFSFFNTSVSNTGTPSYPLNRAFQMIIKDNRAGKNGECLTWDEIKELYA